MSNTNLQRRVDWRIVALYRSDGSMFGDGVTKARAWAERRVALSELRAVGAMSAACFAPPVGSPEYDPEIPNHAYTGDEIDWTAFDVRFDLHLMPAEPNVAPELLGTFDSPELATAAAKRYVKKHRGVRVEVTTATMEET